MSKICIGGHLLDDCFYCYSKKIKSAVANEFLIHYSLVKRASYVFLGRELLFIDLKLGAHTTYLKSVQRSNKKLLNVT